MPEVPSGSTPYYSITINNLYAKWNDWEVVDTLKDICLSIREKQHFAVVGERGSGKVGGSRGICLLAIASRGELLS